MLELAEQSTAKSMWLEVDRLNEIFIQTRDTSLPSILHFTGSQKVQNLDTIFDRRRHCVAVVSNCNNLSYKFNKKKTRKQR